MAKQLQQPAKVNYFLKYQELIIPTAVVFALMIYSWLPTGDSGPAGTQVPKSTASSESEADAITNCEAAVRRQIKNPSTFETAWTWDTQVSGYFVILKRNFTAMNGFGANIDHFYKCRYDWQDRNIVSLEIEEGNWK